MGNTDFGTHYTHCCNRMSSNFDYSTLNGSYNVRASRGHMNEEYDVGNGTVVKTKNLGFEISKNVKWKEVASTTKLSLRFQWNENEIETGWTEECFCSNAKGVTTILNKETSRSKRESSGIG